jgi:small subunit ribosomal protein S6
VAASYDLFVLLDPEVPEERRSAVVEQVKSQLSSSGGTLRGDADWGMRRLSYEIDHRREAQYHLFQFEGSPDVLTQLNRTLSIDDVVLRHRIIRLPGEAPAETPRPTEDASRRPADDRPRDGVRERPADESAAPPASAEAASPEPAGEQEAPVAEETAPEEAPVEAPGGSEAPPDEAA